MISMGRRSQRVFRISALLIPLLAVVDRPSASQAPGVDELMDHIARNVDGLRAVRARFRQEVEMVLMGEIRRFEGNVSYMHPDRLRLEYDEPKGQLLVCDGAFFWMVLTDGMRPQVFKTPVGEKIGGFISRTALKILTEGHEVEYGGEEIVEEEPCYRLSFVPKAGAQPGLFQHLSLWVGQEDLLTRRISYDDLAGNRITYIFSAWREVDPFPDGTFSFVPPPEADLFEDVHPR